MTRSFDANVISQIIGKNVWAAVANRLNVFLIDPAGLFAFEWRGPGNFEGHWAATSDSAIKCVRAGREALRLMFAEYGAEQIWGATPIANEVARRFNTLCGMQSLGIVEMPDRGPAEIFVKRM
ncbi:hypothetical protein [Parasphingopyxis sp.]|uniref:hypothetical protein n=1 Tax=Parasphingopyxis sp. TaxID=1920299 RepID=UPI0026138232|nr:hypothetical protein [Parasphingopyxis sp.]